MFRGQIRVVIFFISLQKEESIANMGFWDAMHWHWNLTWRRHLFRWVIQQLEELLSCLKEANLSLNAMHRLRISLRIKVHIRLDPFQRQCGMKNMLLIM